MGNANIFRKLKERYDRDNISSSYRDTTISTATTNCDSFDDDNEIMVISSSGWPTSSTAQNSQPNIIITPMVIDSPCNGNINRNSENSPCDSKDNSPSSSVSSSPRTSISSPSSMSISPSSSPMSSTPSTPVSSRFSSLTKSLNMSPTSVTSMSSSSSASTGTSTAATSKKRFSLKAAIQNKLGGRTPKKAEILPWIPTNPELILDEKGLHEVFDRFDADRNGMLCTKEMKNMVLELLEYCIAVEKALLKQAQSSDDAIAIDLASHSLIRLQSIQSSHRLIDMWTLDLSIQLDVNKDGRVDRTDFVRSFNHHLRLY